MSLPIKALEDGLGKPVDVIAHHAESLTALGRNADKYISAFNAVADLCVDVAARHATLAAICSIANLDFRDTGRLYNVSPAGTIDGNYYASGGSREVICTLLGV